MTCGFRNAAGTDLDNLFLTTNQNAGALGFRQSDGVDLGNKYTHETQLGYAVGYKNKAGTDIGFLRGREFSNPKWSNASPAEVYFWLCEDWTEDCWEGDSSTECWWETYVAGTAVVCQFRNPISNYQAGHSYSVEVHIVFWTPTGDSKGASCNVFYPMVLTNYAASGSIAMPSLCFNAAAPGETKYPLPSSNHHDADATTGNRHNINNLDNAGGRCAFTAPFDPAKPPAFRVYWGKGWHETAMKFRYRIIDNANGKSSGWWTSPEYWQNQLKKGTSTYPKPR